MAQRLSAWRAGWRADCQPALQAAPHNGAPAMSVLRGLPLLLCAVYGATALDNGLGELPPMGWNSWNLAGCAINETFFRDTVDALAAKGFKEAGYTYINLDEYAAFLCTASALLVRH